MEIRRNKTYLSGRWAEVCESNTCFSNFCSLINNYFNNIYVHNADELSDGKLHLLNKRIYLDTIDGSVPIGNIKYLGERTPDLLLPILGITVCDNTAKFSSLDLIHVHHLLKRMDDFFLESLEGKYQEGSKNELK
jgi:hypothetical protein